MAQLKDLIVNGASRLIGDAFTNKIQITTINAPTSAGGTTYGAGTSGQVLKTNGTSIYWGADSNSVTGVKGNSESSYRTGNVNITAANIGLGNVENTALSTWAGSTNITTLGTISTGTVPLSNTSGILPIDKGGTGATTVADALSNLGLTTVLHFRGISSTALNDGDTTSSIITTNNETITATLGDVVFYEDSEYVWSGSYWERLGRDSSFKITQTAVSDPNASGTSTTFISTISQDTNGVITPTKATLPSASDSVAGITKVGASGGAAAYNHTHTTTLATDAGTSTIGLSYGGKYKLTAGGTSVIFTMPADNNTDTLVKQTAKSDNVNYKLLFNTTASPTSGTAYEAYYDTGITVNPSTDTITATNFAGNASTATTLSSTLPINKGGTNATTALAARQNLRVFYGNDIGNISSPTEGDIALIYYTGTYPGGSSSGGGGSGVTSVRVRATAPVNSSVNTAQTNTLDTTISLNSGYGDTQNPYGSKTANYVLAAPNGSAGAPTFRALVAADTPAVLPLTGGTLTGNLTIQKTSSIADNAAAILYLKTVQTDNSVTSQAYLAAYDDHDASAYGTNLVIQSAGNVIIGGGESPNAVYANAVKGQSNANLTTGANACTFSETGENLILSADGAIYFLTNCNTIANRNLSYLTTDGYLYVTRCYGAVWNDYAEYREATTDEPGRCVIEVGDDKLVLSTERMQPGAEIVSDTFGFAIGKTENAKTPIASSGRVLAYPYESKEEFRKNIGKPVCSGPNGTVSIMTDEEYAAKGYCAIGTISAVPDYEIWGENDIAVNGRVWIRVR